MHHRTRCLCFDGARTVARRPWFYSKIPFLLGGRSSRCHFINPSFQLQAPSSEAKNGTHNLVRTDSILHGLSSEVDKDIRELLTVKQEEAKDVFIDDLSATLEAHRTTNRATTVRKLTQQANYELPYFKRPLIAPKIIAVDAPAEDGLTLPGEQGVEVAPKPLGTSMTVDNTNDDGTDLHGHDFRVATEEKFVSDEQQKKPRRKDMRSTNWPADSVQNEQRRGKRYSIGRHEVLEYEAIYIAPRGDYSSKLKRSSPWLARLSHFDRKWKTASRR